MRSAFALFLSAMFCATANASPMLTHGGLEVSLFQTRGCPSSTAGRAQLTIEAADPAVLFKPGNLETALQRAKDQILATCPRLGIVEFRAKSGEYYLGGSNIHTSTGWRFVHAGHHMANAELFGTGGAVSAYNRGAPSRLPAAPEPAGAHKFYFEHTGSARMSNMEGTANGVGLSAALYSEMSTHLAGTSYLFTPFASEELTRSPSPGLVDDASRKPDFIIDLARDGVSMLRDGNTYNGAYRKLSPASYDPWTRNNAPAYECFEMPALRTDKCFIIVRLKNSKAVAMGAYQPEMLAYIENANWPSPAHKQFVLVGYMEATSSQTARQKLVVSGVQDSQLAQDNQRAQQQGLPKPHIDFSYVQPGLERQLMTSVYERTLQSGSTASQTSTHQLLFLTYHQAFNRVCMSTYSGATKRYLYTNYQYVGSEHTYLKTTYFYKEYVSGTVDVQADHFSKYAAFADSVPRRMFLEGASAETHWTQYATMMEGRGLKFSQTQQRFLEAEGCGSPTVDRYQSNLAELVN